MIILKLTDSDVGDIAEALDCPEVPERSKRKLLAISMHHEGADNDLIRRCLKLSPSTLTRYLREFRDGGITASLEDRFYRPSSSLEPFWECLRCSFMAAPAASAKDAVRRIEALTGITLSESQCIRTMRKMGMSPKKCAPVPAKADPQLQLDFFREELEPRLEEASRGERKVYFTDAAHFVLGSFLGMVWCFSRPLVKTSPGRQRYSVLGAVDSHSKELVSVRTRGNVDSMTVCDLLHEISRRHPSGEVTLVMDNARYQRNRFVMDAAAQYGIELLFLPPYSPNLNLIERLWKLVKKRCLTNHYHENFESFVAAIDSCLDSLSGKLKDEVKSLLSLNFQFFPIRQS